MEKQHQFSHFSHQACEYYPCHAGADPDSFNCLFCYCPLYVLGEECGGDFSYTKAGVKDCSACLLPHGEGGFDYVTGSFSKIVEMLKKR